MPQKIIRKSKYWVYMLRCQDGTYYTGYTKDLENRIALHKSGKGAKYVKYKLPAELVYAKEYRYYKSALNEEKRIKKLKREQKSELVRIYADNNLEISE
ncbi:MAG: GIY-YIG nuclease family protein [Sedimentisphaerales bacterium]